MSSVTSVTRLGEIKHDQPTSDSNADKDDVRKWTCDVCYVELEAPNVLSLADKRRHHRRDKHGRFDTLAGENPADMIPDIPENKEVRDFLLRAPTKGLFMPLGKEVKVMQCWRCKKFGHRTGDKECPLFLAGNPRTETTLKAAYDPMAGYIGKTDATTASAEARDRVALYQKLLQEDTPSDSETSSSESGVSDSESKNRKKSKKRKGSSTGKKSKKSHTKRKKKQSLRKQSKTKNKRAREY